MITQFDGKRQASSLANAATNTLAWVIYAALVLAATQVFRFHGTMAVAAATLTAAVVLDPLRRRAAHAASQRLNQRLNQR